MTRTLGDTPDQVALARRIVKAQIEPEHALGPRRDDLLLAVSEVVTNALVHGNAGPSLNVLVGTDGARICVRDAGGTGFPGIVRRERDAVGGHGMALVDRLADRWGFIADTRGCAVWMEFGDCAVLAGEGLAP